MNIEKNWITEAGLRAVVIATDMGHRCGYVAVPVGHKLYGVDYDETDVDVHGGLTYAGGDGKYPVEANDLWWFGYDCAHLGDARDPDLMSPKYKVLSVLSMRFENDVVRSRDFCIGECESLAKQLVGVV